MKPEPTVFLQIVILLIGVVLLSFLLWEPTVEGRNVNATLFQIYFTDPFLAYIYLGFVPVFVALYQGFRLLGYARRDNVISDGSVRSLWIIKYCSLTTAIFVLGGELYIFLFVRRTDDIAGGMMMGLFVFVVCAVVGTAAAVFERILQNAVEIKSENDLTV